MNKKAIVCVDDEQTILDSLKVELKYVFGNEYLIETAEDAEDALELFQELLEENYDLPLVISDYMMPNLKGDEFLKRIHAISPETRKVMLTGQADLTAVVNAINEAKLYRYISKPWNAEDLALTVSEAIKSYFNEKQLVEKHLELERKIATFHKFVPVQFLKILGIEEYDQIQLGNCVEKNMSILFADIRGFTAISEQLTPKENFNFINNYLKKMEPIIIEHNGFIDKYIGDAIMALFPSNDAVLAAIAMLKEIVKSNQERQRNNLNEFSIGIGIHTGQLMLGTVGGENRMDSTVISDAVNLASRIEGLTKIYGTPLLITQQTYRRLTNISQYKIRLIDRVTVKGKKKAVTVYEIFNADSPVSIELKCQTKVDFERGIWYFQNEEFKEAKRCFEKVLQVNERDQAAQIYLRNAQNILSMIMAKSPQILIVDDSSLQLHVLSDLLKSNNFEVFVAANGEQALEVLEYQHPHLILLDVIMPGMDGFETCSKIKANSKIEDIPIIFMTALADTASKVKGFQAGAIDYITKPFHNDEVLARIKTHLNLSHLQNIYKFQNSVQISNFKLKKKIDRLIVGSFS
jgi:DNA-binding response OmpR family regulator